MFSFVCILEILNKKSNIVSLEAFFLDLCSLENFENISEMRKKAIICSDGKKIGHIIDVVFDSKFQLHSFIVGGSFWEEFRESLGIIDDIDPVVPVENIVEINSREIRIDLHKDQLKHKFEEEIFPKNGFLYSNLKRKGITDIYDRKIGKICNMVFLPCGEASFIVNCPKGKNFVPKGITSKWDLLLPSNEIESISNEKIKLNINAETLEKTLNNHILDADAARNYLNSLEQKNTAELRAFIRTYPGYYLK
ncbi:MAG: PRC-barrel domain containing protein [Candidatus Lokiarchaeota archaeon]|nr:PRC-barrel domain containing protein [Candidatus Lokiarchaeota archaeon]